MEELLSLKWNNHRSTFIHILGVLRDKQLYTDATLACDGKFYNVHKLVMSTCSDYFSAIFDKTACKNPVIVLKDIKNEDLEALLDYMYLGEVNVRQCDLASLIKSAECLRIKGLAVPDDEPPKKSSSNRDSKKQEILGSPPSKRRRREEMEDGRDDVRPDVRPDFSGNNRSSPNRAKSPSHSKLSPVRNRSNESRIPSHSPSRSQSQDPSQGAQLDSDKFKDIVDAANTPNVKLELEDPPDDDIQDAETFDLTNDGFKEEADDDDIGDLSNDLPEFLQSGSSGHLQGSNFPPGSFAGPSAYQSGDMTGWQGDNSNLGFPPHLNYSSSDATGQQNAPGMMEFIMTSRGGRKLLLDGYAYIVDKRKHNITYWRCERKEKRCSGRLKTEGDIIQGEPNNKHSHPPDPERILALKQGQEIRDYFSLKNNTS